MKEISVNFIDRVTGDVLLILYDLAYIPRYKERVHVDGKLYAVTQVYHDYVYGRINVYLKQISREE